MRKSLLALSVLATTVAIPAQAEYLYGFANMSVNYLDWSSDTTDRSGKEDFTYLELEGGSGYSWGELYGFADIENLENGFDETRTSIKGSVAWKTGIEELRLYGQLYNTNSAGFTAQNTVTGVSYNFSGDNWYFNPWVGFHHTITTNSFQFDNSGNQLAAKSFSGMNGGMFGWALGYNFNLGEQKFTLSNWHETEFGRKDDYLAASGESDDLSMNGAVALWWNATDAVTTGIQYRYADNKLGQTKLDQAVIYTVKYNF